MASKGNEWAPHSWRHKQIKQQPTYDDAAAYKRVLQHIKVYPPLVYAGEVEELKQRLAATARGEMILLQGGDCAERFADCNQGSITRKLKIMLQMSLVLSYGARRPVLRIGRIAGQYAKPRSSDTEIVGGVELPSYRGDAVNSFEATPEARRPDPERLRLGYTYAAMTLNYIRALTRGGFADLHNADHWNLDFVSNPDVRQEYQETVQNVLDVISFMESLGSREDKLGWVDFYTSHEGLHLALEECHTQYVPMYDAYYNLGAHMLWIGDRTRDLDGAHVEYFRGIANPIGIKVGPSADPRDIVQLMNTLNPKNAWGRLVLITRFGKGQVAKYLPGFIAAVKEAGLKAVWTVDPMHGNVIKTDGGIKTRDFNDILSELKDSFRIHNELDNYLGGVHFELTGDDVTECIGGSMGLAADDLASNYQSHCDPRLNYSQSLEMALLMASVLREQWPRNSH